MPKETLCQGTLMNNLAPDQRAPFGLCGHLRRPQDNAFGLCPVLGSSPVFPSFTNFSMQTVDSIRGFLYNLSQTAVRQAGHHVNIISHLFGPHYLNCS